MPFVILLLVTTLSAFAGARDNLLFLKQDYCVCQDGKAVSYGNCASFCSDENTNGAEILFASFNVAENKKYKTVYEWCTKKNIWDFRNPKCVVSFKDEEGKTTDVDVYVQDNLIKADVTALDYDKVMLFNLKETVSKALSNSAQIIKFNSEISYPLPLQQGYLNQFTCYSKSEQKNYQFYFAPRMPPTAQSVESDFFCHDWIQYGNRDSETFPRYLEVPAAVMVWPATSPLFHDNNGNGNLDVNDAIRQRTKLFGGSIPLSANFFQYLTLPGNNDLYFRSGTTKTSGAYTMGIWIDQTTYHSYCPNEAHYQSSNPLYRALGDVIGTPTEGLYAGVDADGKLDVVLLRETDIKSVWFYLKNNRPQVPTNETVGRVAVYFYYPLDKVDPYTKKPDQRLYKVTDAQELGMGTNTSYPAHDRKLACIPKI